MSDTSTAPIPGPALPREEAAAAIRMSLASFERHEPTLRLVRWSVTSPLVAQVQGVTDRYPDEQAGTAKRRTWGDATHVECGLRESAPTDAQHADGACRRQAKREAK